jgi:D-alanine--poly(phosphoribitol) ligase subunit 2
MQETIVTILSNICGVDADELELDLNLFEAGLLDSFAILQLLSELESTFNVPMDVDKLTREQIATPEKIEQLIREMS